MSATNNSSKFTPFSISLANNATLTGLSHIPSQTWTKGSARPLIVALHGGTCTAHHYDITPEYTSSTTSESTGIPIVSINRPCYPTTSSFLPLSGDGNTFWKETAAWLHSYIFPAIWSTFATPNYCSGLVLISHSMGVPPTIITAALYAAEPAASRTYVLSGLVLAGWGAPGCHKNLAMPIDVAAKDVRFPAEAKRLMMVSEPSLRLADPDLLPLVDAQSVGLPAEEMLDARGSWPGYWTEYARLVQVPVLYRMGEHDWLWKTDDESRAMFRDAFTSCTSFDSGMIEEGCHALEMGWKAQEWYNTVFGFAKDVCQENAS